MLDIKDSDKEQAARAMFYKISTFLYVEYIVRGDKKPLKGRRLCLRRENISILCSTVKLLKSFFFLKLQRRKSLNEGQAARAMFRESSTLLFTLCEASQETES